MGTDLIWKKYTKIREILQDQNQYFKTTTYLSTLEVIIKEIDLNNNAEIKFRIQKFIEKIKKLKKFHIYEFQEINNKMYFTIDKENSEKFDQLINEYMSSQQFKNEGIIQYHSNPLSFNEILNLFEKKKMHLQN